MSNRIVSLYAEGKKAAPLAIHTHKVTSPVLHNINDCIVVIPTYNERENISLMIKELKNLHEAVDILIVDDNSPDGTAIIVEQLIERYDGLYLIKRPHKGGLGSAYKDGFRFALRTGWKYICQMDADFSHDPQELSLLINACRNGADIAVGSRYISGGKIEGWPWRRWLLSRAANLYAQIMTRHRVKDMTSGFKCFKNKALGMIDLSRVSSEGYIFQVEMNYWAKKESLILKQVPICFSDRRFGLSKLGKNEAYEGMRQLLKLVFDIKT